MRQPDIDSKLRADGRSVDLLRLHGVELKHEFRTPVMTGGP